MRVTPENIVKLERDEIFVFGSNEQGVMGAGAALLARVSFGAKNGQGFGPSGRTFALPTKDWNIETLPVRVIRNYVDRFISYAKDPKNQRFKFMVTAIGTGLSNIPANEMAPLFKECLNLENIWLPQIFIDNMTTVYDSTIHSVTITCDGDNIIGTKIN